MTSSGGLPPSCSIHSTYTPVDVVDISRYQRSGATSVAGGQTIASWRAQ